ncbi:hypothetical protein DERP_002073 [Dermatophagoides pteronyssinus]|uniref:Uncharacterized protein n=1 Tax=Dermatophagoides pteronyssinus TaxID=6956 RepID=A0ABQ8JHA2_DERPT|nr:hypothetical protein DERP_002073 [Dermatophagoides pteronyssinus]
MTSTEFHVGIFGNRPSSRWRRLSIMVIFGFPIHNPSFSSHEKNEMFDLNWNVFSEFDDNIFDVSAMSFFLFKLSSTSIE